MSHLPHDTALCTSGKHHYIDYHGNDAERVHHRNAIIICIQAGRISFHNKYITNIKTKVIEILSLQMN